MPLNASKPKTTQGPDGPSCCSAWWQSVAPPRSGSRESREQLLSRAVGSHGQPNAGAARRGCVHPLYRLRPRLHDALPLHPNAEAAGAEQDHEATRPSRPARRRRSQPTAPATAAGGGGRHERARDGEAQAPSAPRGLPHDARHAPAQGLQRWCVETKKNAISACVWVWLLMAR
jgi:hypothetical protein